MSAQDPRKEFREEKAQYDEAVEKEAEETKEILERQEALVPVCNTGKAIVDKLMREYYDEETVKHLKISEDRIPGLVKALKTMHKNSVKYAGPQTCAGPKCHMAARCPLQKAFIAPVAHSCPVEQLLMDTWEKQYIEDLGVDIQSKIEIDLVRDMIEADLIDWRTSHEIAKGGLFDWNAVGVTPEGKVITKKEEAIAIGIKLKFKSRKDRLREDLLATRKIRAKLGLSKQVDPSKFASSLNERFKEIQDAEATTIDDKPDDDLQMPGAELELDK